MPQFKTFIILLMIQLLALQASAQSKKGGNQKWENLKESAHRIGFCVYHSKKDLCKEHLQVDAALKILETDEFESYYFILDSAWAENRINEWAKKHDAQPDDYIMLFDIDQGAAKLLQDTTNTSNTYRKFSVFNMREKLSFTSRGKSDSELVISIVSEQENSILTNSLWREFMSGRIGLLETQVAITLKGNQAVNDYSLFKKAFLKFR